VKIKEKCQQIELMKNLTAEQLTGLEKICEVYSQEKDTLLFRVGEEATNVFFLLEGKVSIQVPLSSRPEMVSIVILSKNGQLIGWSGLMGPSYYTADAICLEDSKFLKIHGEEFLKILEMDKEAGFGVMQGIVTVISERLRNIQRVVLKTM
jgi:CRP-like cAMP-binding protein